MILALTAGAALAHSGVKNPAVQARMNAMMDIAGATKVLGNMAKGTVPFDAAAAREAAAQIADKAAQVPTLFAAPETDPKSEAAPAIWQDFATFTAQARQMETAASAAAAQIAAPEDLRAGLAAIGATCASCHKAYRITGN